jgi:hypothetical protein
MFSYGLTENIDFTAEKFFLSVNNGAKQDIGDYLHTIDAAKHIAMVQRSDTYIYRCTYKVSIVPLAPLQSLKKVRSYMNSLNAFLFIVPNGTSIGTIDTLQPNGCEKKYELYICI